MPKRRHRGVVATRVVPTLSEPIFNPNPGTMVSIPMKGIYLNTTIFFSLFYGGLAGALVGLGLGWTTDDHDEDRGTIPGFAAIAWVGFSVIFFIYRYFTRPKVRGLEVGSVPIPQSEAQSILRPLAGGWKVKLLSAVSSGTKMYTDVFIYEDAITYSSLDRSVTYILNLYRAPNGTIYLDAVGTCFTRISASEGVVEMITSLGSTASWTRSPSAVVPTLVPYNHAVYAVAGSPQIIPPPITAVAPLAAPTSVPNSASVADELAKLSSLHQQGHLTDEEYATAKIKILS